MSVGLAIFHAVAGAGLREPSKWGLVEEPDGVRLWLSGEAGANSRGNRQGKGPEAGVHLARVRNS